MDDYEAQLEAFLNGPKPSLEAQASKMSEELHKLEREKSELEAQLEASVDIAKTRGIIATVIEMTADHVIIKSEYNDGLLALFRSIEGRQYIGQSRNRIPRKHWLETRKKLKNLGVQVVDLPLIIEVPVIDEVSQFKVAPDAKPFVSEPTPIPVIPTPEAAVVTPEIETIETTWTISLAQRHIRAKPAEGMLTTWQIRQLPGSEWSYNEKAYKIPLSEAWRFADALKEVEGVVYTEEVEALIVHQLSQRKKIDEIADLDRGIIYLDYEMGDGHKLRHFQEVGCDFIEATDGRTLLADEMGLGKTWQALAYAIKNNLRTVVICPASLKNNWAREIMKLSGKRPLTLFGAVPSQFDMVRMVAEPPQFTIINYDIAGRKTVTKTITKDKEGFEHERTDVEFLWMELINMSRPDLVVIDEGHYIKNVDSNRSQAVRQVKAPRIIIMTGTPVLNRPSELWAMATLLQPEIFPAYETFLRQYTYNGKYTRNIDELRQVMKTFMIRRLKKDVVADLPPINKITEYHELSPKAQKLYDKVLMGVYEAVAEYSPSGNVIQTQVTNILAQIQRLKMVCAIDKVDRIAEMATDMWDSSEGDDNRKVLIFTQYKAVAYAIWQRLADQGALSFVSRTPTEFKTADSSERDRLVQQFQTDSAIKYMVVTEKTTKEGHNITAAGNVIFTDLFWTPAGHSQAEGRAYGRLDNLHSINSYYVVTDMDGDSIEEWILDLLFKKSEMINEVVEGVEGSRDVSVMNELIQMLKNKGGLK